MIKVTPKIQTQYRKAIANLIEQSDRDYRNLQLAAKAAQAPKAPVEVPKTSFAEGLKNFFENGMIMKFNK